MSRLIDGDALILHLTICQQNGMPTSKFYAIDDVIHYVKTMPTIEPERKTGRWIYGEDNLRTGVDGWFCSECEHFEAWDYSADMKSAELNLPNFCPNCGADMRGEEK